MTQNQIAYWANQEARANNLRAYEINKRNLAETERANQAREKETQRANQMSERLKMQEISMNTLNNQVRNAETMRANMAREYENNRSNMAQESIQRSQVLNAQNQVAAQRQKNYYDYSVGMANQRVAQQQADTQRLNVLNQNRLGLLSASNQAAQVAASRYNTANQYNIALMQNEIARQELLVRHKANILNRDASLRSYKLGIQQLEETVRHNQSSERITAFGNALSGGARVAGVLLGGRR